MYEAQLRARLDGEVSAPNKDLLWTWLEQDRYVADFRHGRIGWEQFKDAATRLANRQRETLAPTDASGRLQNLPYADVGLTDLEAAHAAALAPYLSKRAALLAEVRSFRNEKLGGGSLKPEQVATFLRHELGYLSPEEYAALELSLRRVALDLGNQALEELKELVGGWNNQSFVSRSRHQSEDVGPAVGRDPRAPSHEPFPQFPHGLMHLIRDRTGRTLEDLGLWLTSRYPWPLRDAAWFVLTDEHPQVESLKIQFDSAHGTYRLSFARWISEKTIRLAYRSLQSGDNRPLGVKSLLAFRFVDENTAPGHTPKWAELTRSWNEKHPEDKFRDRSALRQAYDRAEKHLLTPLWTSKEVADIQKSGR